MANAVIMPKQGQSVESCIITAINFHKGDKVKVGDVLFAYETDKASFEEESKFEGTVLELFFAEGDEVPVLTNVLVIGEQGEDCEPYRPSRGSASVETAAETAAAQSVADEVVAETAQSGIVNENYTVSPRARQLAFTQGINLSTVEGTGPDGRIIERDIVTAVAGRKRLTPLAKAIVAGGGVSAPSVGSGLAGEVRGSDLRSAAATPIESVGEPSTIKPLSNMRKLIAKSMFNSLHNSAQLTHHLSADARRILALRQQVKKSLAEGGKDDISLNDMVCYAVVRALVKFPEVNSHFLGDSMRIFNGVHLGLAVDTDRGLMVPALRNADRMTIAELSAGLKGLAAACRKGAVDPDLLSSEAASFTVSNLGNYGCEMFTPIINLPQSAILGVNTILPRPKDLGNGVYAFVPHIGLSLTYDHRALDGGQATRFLKQIAVEIETMEF